MSMTRTDDQDTESHLLSIGEIARQAGVSSRTIRYYEELEILPAPPRSEKGTRKYPPVYVTYLRWTLTLKQLGFSLDEIKILAPFGRGESFDDASSSPAIDLIEGQIAELGNKMEILEVLRQIVTGSTHGDPTTVNLLYRAAGALSNDGLSGVG